MHGRQWKQGAVATVADGAPPPGVRNSCDCPFCGPLGCGGLPPETPSSSTQYAVVPSSAAFATFDWTGRTVHEIAPPSPALVVTVATFHMLPVVLSPACASW